jgi:hypothetical protein
MRRPTPNQKRQIDAALRTLEPAIERAFREAIASIAGAVDIGALVEAITAGRIEDAVQILRINQALIFPLTEASRASYIAGGALVGGLLPRSLAASFGFDGRHPRAEAWTLRKAGELIEGITAPTLEMARNVIVDGLAAGRGPAVIARDIVGRKIGNARVGGFLGLNSNQTASIIRGRGLLASGDPARLAEYLQLKLRDKRFDRQIIGVINGKGRLTGPDIDRIIDGHRSKALTYRGKVIARTESLNALRAGRHEGFAQLLDSGAITADQIERSWDASGDMRTRPDHAAMNGQTVKGMDEPFIAPDGSRLMYPGDVELGASAAQVIQCRCFERVRIKFIRD